MSNPLIAKYSTSGTYTLKVDSGLYRLTLVGGGGNAYYATTGDADGGYAYTRGWGGGSGGAFSGIISLPAGTYTVVVGGVAGSSYITDSTGETVLSVGGGGNAGSWAVGTAGTAPTVNPNYNVLESTVNKAGNAGLTAKGDWGGGYGTGGSSVYNGFGTGASINSGGSWGRTDGGFELLTYTESRHNKFYALKKDVFDINKITVVGSPTITSDGVASGLSNNDYIVPTSLTLEQLKGKSWSYSFKCTIPDTSASSKYIISFANNLFPSLVGGIKFEGYGIYLGGKYGTTEDSTNELWKMIGTYSRPADVGKEVLITVSFNIETGEYNAKAILDNKELNMTPYIPPTANKELYYINTNSSSKAFRVLVGNDKFYLKSIKITINNQLVYSPTKPTYLIERRKPKVWNKGQFTIVGNPSISDSGVASGFSGSDYVKLSQNYFTNYNTLLINLGEIKTPEKITTNNTVFSLVDTNRLYNNVKIGILLVRLQADGSVALYINFKPDIGKWDFSKISSVKLATNTKYFLRLRFDNIKYYLEYSLDGDSWLNLIEADYSKTFDNYNLSIIGLYGSELQQPFTGSINLKQFKIYTDNNLVFDGGADTYVYDPSKFTVVGSPTITEYGVASGFSGNNYIEAPKIDLTKPFTINIKIKTSSTLSAASNEYFLCGDDNRTFIIGIDYGKIHAWISSNNSSWDIGYASGGVLLNPDTEYFIRFSWDGNIYKIDYSTDNVDFVNGITINSSTPIYPINRIFLGSWATNGNELTGSINLPSFSTTVDGKEVFTGAKENYYMLRR